MTDDTSYKQIIRTLQENAMQVDLETLTKEYIDMILIKAMEGEFYYGAGGAGSNYTIESVHGDRHTLSVKLKLQKPRRPRRATGRVQRGSRR